ncbi:MAG: diadenylate cyclase, partial [Aphanizomenon sp.]
TRHRAAMGITERVENCICVVVSEETGSISLAEQGTLYRPLTIKKLKESLEARFSPTVDREAVAPGLVSLVRQLGNQSLRLISRLPGLPCLRHATRSLFPRRDTTASQDKK